MGDTFLRFQEHYESPEFMGKIFTHKEFKIWYKKANPGSIYHEDWDGFNLPISAFKPFLSGKFGKLTPKEKKILQKIKNLKDDSYIIAYQGEGHHLLGHELAHALYYTNKTYQKKVLAVMKKFNVESIKKELKSYGAYHDKVLYDEIQAYSVSLNHELDSDFPKKMINEIYTIFKEYCPKII